MDLCMVACAQKYLVSGLGASHAVPHMGHLVGGWVVQAGPLVTQVHSMCHCCCRIAQRLEQLWPRLRMPCTSVVSGIPP